MGTFQKSNDNYHKGIIMCFYVNNEPYYEYMPFMCTEDESQVWQANMMEKHQK